MLLVFSDLTILNIQLHRTIMNMNMNMNEVENKKSRTEN